METSQEDLLQVVDVEQKAFSLLEVTQMTEAGEESNLHRPENEDGDARLTVQEDAQILQEGIAGAGQQIMRDVTDEQVSCKETAEARTETEQATAQNQSQKRGDR